MYDMVVVEKEIIAKNYYNNYKNNLFFQWSVCHEFGLRVEMDAMEGLRLYRLAI